MEYFMFCFCFICLFLCIQARWHYHTEQKHKHSHHKSPTISFPPPPAPPPGHANPPDQGGISPDPSQVFDVRSFGAVGDGVADDTHAFNMAWDAACDVDSATILVPNGFKFMIQSTIFTGPCHGGLVFQVFLYLFHSCQVFFNSLFFMGFWQFVEILWSMKRLMGLLCHLMDPSLGHRRTAGDNGLYFTE